LLLTPLLRVQRILLQSRMELSTLSHRILYFRGKKYIRMTYVIFFYDVCHDDDT
jgi:hypothetical protein